jgi:hypothetical protein
MRKVDQEVEQRFYEAVAEILSTEYEYRRFPFSKKTRWNNRTPGNGRYIGHGIVRMFGLNCIQVNLRSPRLAGFFVSTDDALEAIRAAMQPADIQ